MPRLAIACLSLFTLAISTARPADEISLETAAPVVVKSVPEAGTDLVDASTTTELRVTFSKPMMPGSWSWARASATSFPEVDMTRPAAFAADGRTAILPVKLEPGKTYAVRINTESLKNFKDTSGRPALPYTIVFRTKP